VAVDFSISDRSFFKTYFRGESVDKSEAKQKKQSEREYLKNKTSHFSAVVRSSSNLGRP
jgi:hypothetical protein